MYAFGSVIDVRMKESSGCFACCASAVSLSRSGPTFPLAPAAVSVWQAPQPLFLKIAAPAVPGFGDVSAFDWLVTHLLNAAGSITTAVERIVAWPRPHSSLQITGYVPSRVGVTLIVVVSPGTMSMFSRNSGTKKAWMTSFDWKRSCTSRPFGSMSVALVRPFASG